MSGNNLIQSLQQRQTQTQVLAPQIQQSLKILQAATLDLRAVIQNELQSNPALEELPPDQNISLERAAEDAASAGASDGDTTIDRPDPDDPDGDITSDPGAHATGETTPSDNPQTANRNPQSDDGEAVDAPLDFSAGGKEYDILQKLDQDWRDHMASAGGAQPYTAADAERRQHFLDSFVSEISLQEHLLAQAADADLPEKTGEALRHLIGSLDDRGYLAQSPADIALQTGLPLETILDALRLLQTFDPAGIGAQNIAESLLIQLAAKNRGGNTLAARILREHFELLARRRIPELARKLNATPADIQAAIAEIGALDPAPARRFADDTNRVVIPDVTVTKDAATHDWKISLNNDYIPRLRISNTYRELIAKGALNKAERDYIAGQMRSGKFLIDSVERRQQTIERITREIIRRQREFFEEGVSKLKPLTMGQIADELGLHETTVSRAVANKYIKTPHGVFEMKYFFTTGYQSASGESISNTSVKEMLAALVAAEDRARPMSDEDISVALQEKGINISRRTVAKYREELGIPASSLRRDYAG